MIIDKDNLFRIISDRARREVKVAIRTIFNIKTAKVTEIRDGRAIIQFDEDSLPSQKIYPAFKSYLALLEVGDRVLLIKGIIIGGWRP